MAQSVDPHIIVVDNGSVDDSAIIIKRHYPTIELIRHTKNEGYAGGINPGFRRAIEMRYDYVAPFNNDAIADKGWLKYLVGRLEQDEQVGVAACKLLSADKQRLDSTGESYTPWGLPFPRGRGESDLNKYDELTEIFAGSGGASLFRVAMLEQIGLMDEDFFAYYEDVDLSFRAQLAGWKVAYVPESVVYHEISTTGSRIKGFFTEQTMKNLPMLLTKNVPTRYLPKVLPRFTLVYLTFFASAAQRGQLWYAIKGSLRALTFWPKKLKERHHIQKNRTVHDSYIWSMLEHDLPPNAHKLRSLRAAWWKLIGKGK
jgi:GT2 family glycosyltransferase